MRYTLKQLRYFLAAAETGSVTRASEMMNVSQPSISTAISQLEDTFGIQLFIRHHAQGVSLTPAGKRFVLEANRFMSEADGFETYAKDLGKTIVGNLDVGCISTVAPIAMPSLMRVFYQKYPSVVVKCKGENQEQLLTGLLEGRYEFALTYDMQIGMEYLFEPLVDLKPYAILPVDHPLAENKTVSLVELASFPMVLLDLPLSREYFSSLFLSVGAEPLITYRVDSLEMVRSMVGNSFGYSLANAHLDSSLKGVARSEIRSVDGTHYREVPLSDDLLPLSFGLVKLKDIRLTSLAKGFADYCKEYFSKRAVKD